LDRREKKEPEFGEDPTMRSLVILFFPDVVRTIRLGTNKGEGLIQTWERQEMLWKFYPKN
jgi:hypothetical protein